jgi:cytochrome c5
MRVAVAAVALLSVSAGATAEEAPIEDGQQLLESACVQCHPLGLTTVTRDGRPGWEDTVHKMVLFGSQLSVEEMDVLIAYLAERYGPAAGPMRTGTLPPGAAVDPAGSAVSSENITLPSGEGRDLVQGLCSGCHDMGRIVSTRRSAASWQRYTENMLAQGGIAASDEQIASAVSYLSMHFGESPESR